MGSYWFVGHSARVFCLRVRLLCLRVRLLPFNVRLLTLATTGQAVRLMGDDVEMAATLTGLYGLPLNLDPGLLQLWQVTPDGPLIYS